MKTIDEGKAYLFGNNIETEHIYRGKKMALSET